MTEAARSSARRRTGPARSLTREQVIDVALDVMSNQGLDAVSFRTVAMRLGVDPKALYTYVNDKDDLLAAMFDKAMADFDIPKVDDPRAPADQIIDLLVSLRRALIKNADLFRLARPLTVPGINAEAWERTAEVLYELDMDPAAALRVYLRLVHYTLGSATYAAHRVLSPQEPITPARAGFDADQHPFVLKLAQEGPLVEDEAGFAATIRIMLNQRIGEP